ncbi:restriction endonuclease subunit S [Paenibacillus sp. DYY-L-2]|uniref:restriction endonuclease subunit S n=1 Tax=Paenibacillus sp. DYY-L-2 TaxID=3447013 RepID=UPI003F4F4B2D
MDNNIQQATPNLRFAGFKGPWKSTTLGHHIKEYKQLQKGGGSVPIATSSRRGLFLQGEYYSGDRSYVSEDIQFKIVPRGYMTYRHMSDDSIFHFNINNIADEVLVSPEYPVFTTNDTLSTVFIHKYLNSSKRFRKFCEMQKLGGTRTRLYFNKLVQFSLCLPSIEEQQKIASFFSLLDQKIEKQQEKIEQLELFKKGMLQKIFSKEIRFRNENGQEFPDWDSSVLEEIGSFIRNYSFSRSVEGEGEYQHIHYGDIHSKLSGVITSQMGLPSLSIDTEATTYTLLKDGDVVFADASEDTSDLGKSVVLLEGGNRKIIGGLHTHCFRPDSRLDSLFLHYFTQTTEYRKFINVNANGVSVFGLSKPALSSLEVPLPDIKEQRKISSFLYKLSQKIELLKKKKTELEAMKKGFMNQMFV